MTQDPWDAAPSASWGTPTPSAERPTAVYRLYAEDDELLYVGMTNNVIQRFTEHRDTKKWWPNVASYSVAWFPTRAKAEGAEALAIFNEWPIHNIDQQPRSKPYGGLPLLPWFLFLRFGNTAMQILSESCPDMDPDKVVEVTRALLFSVQDTVVHIQGKTGSCPAEHHPLDLDALVKAVGDFGPLLPSLTSALPSAAPKAIEPGDEW